MTSRQSSFKIPCHSSLLLKIDFIEKTCPSYYVGLYLGFQFSRFNCMGQVSDKTGFKQWTSSLLCRLL